MITKSFQHFQLVSSAPGNGKSGKGGTPDFMSAAGKSFNSVLGKVMSQKNSSDSTLSVDNYFDQKKIKGEKENSLVDSLMANIQLDGMSPDDLEVDSKGLKLLENLLEGLGFGEDEIANFMSDLTDGGEKKELSLSGLLTKLNSFLKSGKSHDELSMSAVPGIESILGAMGIDSKDIENILYKAGGDKGGLDLQKLLAGLKTISAKGNEAGTIGELEMNSGNQLIVSGLGLSPFGKKTASLNDFIKKLEELANNKNGQLNDGTTTDNIAKKFAEHIQSGADKNSGNKSKSENNAFLNNHSFQKQQQMIEENCNLEELGLKNKASLKSETAKFMIKDGAVIMNEQNSQGGGAHKQNDSGAQSFKMGMTADSMVNKTTDSVFKLPTERTLPSYVTNQVSMKIANAVKNGDTEFKIQIKPAEMGRLQISLDFTKTGLKVGILAEHTATRDMLLSNSSELRSILADQGIRLDKVQVDVSGNFDQSMADARKESNNSGKKQGQQKETENLFDKIAANETIRFTDEAYVRSEIGRLSLVV